MRIPKVSILVPIYNVEKYLEQCLESLVAQSLEDIEIICIDDGSTDKSAEILNRIAKKDKRLVVVKKENSGYGDSMNIGLLIAKGEYVGIVEPDDFIDKFGFEKMYNIARTDKADIVRADYYEFSESGRKKMNVFEHKRVGKVLKDKEKIELFQDTPAIWSAIYKRSFLEKNDIIFLLTPGASYQDVGFYYKTLTVAEKIILINQAFLNYRIDNVDSSVKSSKKVFEVIKEHQSIRAFLIKNNLLKKYGSAIEPAKFLNYVWNLKRLSNDDAKKFISEIRLEFLEDKKLGLIVKEKFNVTQWILIQLLLKSGDLFFCVVRGVNWFKNLI